MTNPPTCSSRFIGSPAMNRFEVTAERGGIRVGSALLQPPEAQLDAAKGHGKLIAEIRPEHLSIGEGELTVKVALVEDLGSDLRLWPPGRRPGEQRHRQVRPPASPPRRGRQGDRRHDHLHLFDAVSGLRIGD